MRKKQIFNHAVKGFAVGALVLSLGGGIALATSTSTSTSTSKSAVTRGFKDPEARKKALQNQLNRLVKEEKLSQEKANKIIAYLEKKVKERKKVDLYTDLVNQKIITEKEAAVLKEALPHLGMKKGHHRGKRNPEEHKQALINLLSTLVKDKKISQDTANKVTAFFDKKAEQRQKGPFTEMVEQKILTPAEAKILQEAFPNHRR